MLDAGEARRWASYTSRSRQQKIMIEHIEQVIAFASSCGETSIFYDVSDMFTGDELASVIETLIKAHYTVIWSPHTTKIYISWGKEC